MGNEEKAYQNAYVLESEQDEEKRRTRKSADEPDPTKYVSKYTILTYICSRVESPIPRDLLDTSADGQGATPTQAGAATE